MQSPSSTAASGRADGAHEHLVEFYETDEFLVDTVCEFIAPALRGDDAAIIVATTEHRAAFDAGLTASGIDIGELARDGRYLAFDAAELLSAFMVGDAPDPAKFRRAIGAVIDRASAGGRHVRVYGEMVALLWADGDIASTIALEDLWNDLAQLRDFSLFCAYPMQGFDERARAAFKQICRQHSGVIPAEGYTLAGDAGEQQRIVAQLQQENSALRAELARLRTTGVTRTAGAEG